MPSQTELFELPDPAMLEARIELVGQMSGAFGAIPGEHLADHVLRCYPGAPWPVWRGAAEALARRQAGREVEELKLASKPPRREVFGEYQTRRPRSAPRPYRTTLHGLAPLQISCDCPDYLLGGLALCKHGLTVLDELFQKPRRLARALDAPALELSPSWDPIVALEAADALAGVTWTGSSAPSPSLAPLFVERDGEGPAALDPSWLVGERRAELVARLRRSCRRRRHVDPPLLAVLEAEHARLQRLAGLELTDRDRRAAMRNFGLRLYPYQRTALRKFLTTGRLLLADDMGLGKTVQATAISHLLVTTGRIDRVLIICPASLKGQWVREWRRASAVSIELVEGGPERRASCYAETTRGALVANYEQALRDLELMQGFDPQLVILDEAQRIKNWATRTAQAIKRLDVPYRLVLTGTPLENRLDELASIMDWVDPQILAPKWSLAPRHQILIDGAREVIGVRDLDRLRARLAPRMLRRRRSEILKDLPARTDTVLSVELTDAQRVEHDELDQPIARLLAMARRGRLTQALFLRLMSLLTTQRVIANGLAQLNFESLWPSLRTRTCDESLLRTLAMPKLALLRELVESLVLEQGRKIVVFSQWRRMLSLSQWAIAPLLAERGLRTAFFTGAESQRRRRQNVIEFHDEPDLCVLFSTDAGGVGLNLQRAASACVHLELPWNPAVFEQRVARIHRLGQPDPVDVYSLVSEASIEERIAAQLGSKQALFTELFDGDSNEVLFRESTSFLTVVERLVADPLEESTPADQDQDQDQDRSQDQGGAAIEAALDEDTRARVEAADEGEDEGDGEVEDGAVTVSSEPGRPGPGPAPDPVVLPNPARLGELFAELEIRPREDGGVEIQASAQAAEALGALFAGMARLLAAAKPEPTTAGADTPKE